MVVVFEREFPTVAWSTPPAPGQGSKIWVTFTAASLWEGTPPAIESDDELVETVAPACPLGAGIVVMPVVVPAADSFAARRNAVRTASVAGKAAPISRQWPG
jgi:hypothetical protein